MTNPKPKRGEVVEVVELPRCDFCNHNEPAIYDFATVMGPWANGCEMHYRQYRVSPNLGVGIAQRLIVAVSDPRD